MDIQSLITGALGGGSIGIFLKHFLDKDMAKLLFESNFKRDIYFRKQDKALELLKLIDEVKHNLITYKFNKTEDINKDYSELKEYFINKSIIINLSLCYFPILKKDISEYNDEVEIFTIMREMDKYSNLQSDNSEEVFANSLKKIEKILNKLKINISGHLLNEESKII